MILARTIRALPLASLGFSYQFATLDCHPRRPYMRLACRGVGWPEFVYFTTACRVVKSDRP